jgi:hypothetical protein
MARISKEQHLSNVHAEAIAEFDEIQAALRDERLQCLQDRRFYSISGAQWEGRLSQQFENKPKFEVNKIHLAVIRIINEYRNNRISVDFISKDGSERDETADLCNGLYRADVQDSCAEEAFDNAFEEAVGGGFGSVRLRTVYEDEEDDENDQQRIRIEPIFDADSSVFFDLNAKRQDKSDAKRCYVLTAMSRQAYKEEYNDDPTSWPKEVMQTEFDWATPDVVYVCEHYRIEETKETVRTYQALDGTEVKYSDSDFEKNEELETELLETGHREVRQKRVKRKRVRKYILSGSKVLEDLGYIAGKCIPVIPVYGKRWFVDNVERCMGHVRLAKDPQRLKNMQLSKLGEISALSSVEKPIFAPEQITGHEMMWAQDNLKDYPYLLANPITGPDGAMQAGGPVAYTKPPQVPPAMAALLQLTEQDMAEILGNQQQADKMVSNISGKAVEAIQERIDAQAFIYMSNQAKLVQRTGEVWLSMAKDVYIEEGRKMKSIGSQEQVESVQIMKPAVNSDTGEIEYENDLADASFDVVASVGPTSRSKRQATLRSLINMIQITDDPETRQVLTGMAMLNMEGEGIQDVRDFFRKRMVMMGVIKPTEEESAEMQAAAQNQQPDPNAVFLQAAAEEATAKAAQARASVIKTVADSELARAKTIETMAKVDLGAQDQSIKIAQMLGNTLGQPEQIQQPEIQAPPMQ